MTDESWHRLADYLVHRRVELTNNARLSRFLRLRDATDFRRIADDLENHVRSNYDAGTLARAEVIYCWEPGSVRAVLSGGKPIPNEEAAAKVRRAI